MHKGYKGTVNVCWGYCSSLQMSTVNPHNGIISGPVYTCSCVIEETEEKEFRPPGADGEFMSIYILHHFLV